MLFSATIRLMYRQKPCETCPHSGLAPIDTTGDKKRKERFQRFLEHKAYFGRGKKRSKSDDSLSKRHDFLLERYGTRATPPAPQAIKDEFAWLDITPQERWCLRMRKRLRCVRCGELRPCHKHNRKAVEVRRRVAEAGMLRWPELSVVS